MQQMQKTITIPGLILIAAVYIVVTGCETEPVGQSDLSVSPNSVGIRKDQSVEFTASGGYEYSWNLKAGKENWGVLSTRTGNKTTYTSRYDPGTNTLDVYQVLTVTSIIGGSTNSSSGSATAEAYIEHLTTVTPTVSVYVEPSEVTILIGESQTFTAYGGDEYSWSLYNESWGKLSTRIGDTTTYTSLHSASTNTVDVQKLTVTSGSSTFTAYIKHQ